MRSMCGRGRVTHVLPRDGSDGPVAPARRARARLRGAQTLGGRLPQAARALSGRRLQVIDGLDAVQVTLEAIELAAELRDRPTMIRLVAIELPEDVPTALHHRLILDAPGLVEEAGDLARRSSFRSDRRAAASPRRGTTEFPARATGTARWSPASPAGASRRPATGRRPSAGASARPRRGAGSAWAAGSSGASASASTLTVTLATSNVKRYTPQNSPQRRITGWNGNRRPDGCRSASSSGTTCASASSGLAGPSRSSGRWSASWSAKRSGSARKRCARESRSANPCPVPSRSRSGSGSRTSAVASGARGPAGGRSSCRTSSS